MRKYTDAQLDEIRQRYANEHTHVIASSMGIKVDAIYNLAYKLGLKKSPEYFLLPGSGRLQKGERIGIRSQFKKGHVPFNKGAKMSTELYQKCQATMFKKGNRPMNWKPNGTISVRPDKSGHEYLYLKIKDSHWVLYHRYLWEQTHGEIPTKKKIAFINGNSLDCRIENLELIDYKEAMLRNTIHRFTPEIKELIRLNNKLIKKAHGKEQNQ